MKSSLLKGLWWSLHFESRIDVLIYCCIKTPVLFFKKSNQTMAVNGNTESISRTLCMLQV